MQKEVMFLARPVLMGTALLTLMVLPGYANPAVKNPCGPVRESKAYQQYKLRPVSDFSRLIYLIDRFYACDIQIIYNGHYFAAPFAARVARWFLATNYKKETTREWIMRWCSTAVPQGTPIYVKLPNGKFRLAREILNQELEELNKTRKQDETSLPTEVEIAPLAQLMVKPPATSPARLGPSR